MSPSILLPPPYGSTVVRGVGDGGNFCRVALGFWLLAMAGWEGTVWLMWLAGESWLIGLFDWLLLLGSFISFIGSFCLVCCSVCGLFLFIPSFTCPDLLAYFVCWL